MVSENNIINLRHEKSVANFSMKSKKGWNIIETPFSITLAFVAGLERSGKPVRQHELVRCLVVL